MEAKNVKLHPKLPMSRQLLSLPSTSKPVAGVKGGAAPLMGLVITSVLHEGIEAETFGSELATVAETAIPDNCFGVFVTIRRSPSQSLDTWPEDVHGCIGHWDPEYKAMDKRALLEAAIRVAGDAARHDDRRRYFPSLTTDTDALIEVDFMMLPIRRVDAETGMVEGERVPFDNDIFGMIVETPTGQRATYLPGVFDTRSVSWSTFRDSLIGKASSTALSRTVPNRDAPSQFWAYRIIQYKQPLKFALAFLPCSQTPVIQTVDRAYKHFRSVPPPRILYGVNTDSKTESNGDDDRFVRDPTQNVRNVGSLSSLLNLDRETCLASHLSPETKRLMHDDVQYYVDEFKRNPLEMRQAAAFLLDAMHTMQGAEGGDRFDSVKRPMCDFLLDQLGDMEPDFELGEAVMALFDHCDISDSGEGYPSEALETLLRRAYDTATAASSSGGGDGSRKRLEGMDKLFQLNWTVQAISAAIRWTLRNASGEPSAMMMEDAVSLIGHLRNLLEQILRMIQQPEFASLETNYIAVAFEALSVGMTTLELLPVRSSLVKRLQSELIVLYALLVGTRRDEASGLYKFIQIPFARLDITGHVINGSR